MVTWPVTGHGMGGAEVKASHSVNTTIYVPHMVAVAKGFAKEEGIDLKLTEALGGSKTILGGLKAGKLDAIMAVPAWQFRAMDDGYGVPLYDISDKASWDKVFGGKLPASVVYVLEETLKDQPELAQKYVNAIAKAMKWLGEADAAEIYSVVGPFMPRFKEPLVMREIAYYKEIWQYDASFPKEDFANGAKVWFRKNTKIKPLEYEDVAERSSLNKAKSA